MTDHPLTDGIIEEIAQFEPDLTDPLILNRIHDMQTAADWQLEQVTKWLRATKSTVKICPSILADQIEQAMRPQQQEDNQ